jgi:hypothetical protein
MYKFGRYVGQKHARLLNNYADVDGNVKKKTRMFATASEWISI